MMELSDYRRGLFQWDTGRSLIVTEKDITEVHFQLLPPPSGSTETTDVPVTDGVAQIPDDLLQVGLPLRAYAWGDGYSHYDQTLCVTKREKPTGYASTPADAITLESVQAKLQAEIDGKIQMPDGGDAGDVLKKTGSGVEWGQAAGQSDWAENDETAPGYVKNRPGAYVVSETLTVLDKQFQQSDFEASSMGYATETALQNPIIVDAVYTVKIGNETYTAPSLKFTQAGNEMVGIGAIDENKFPDLSKYPFYLGSDAGATEEAWLYLKDAPQSDVSISISGGLVNIEKIPAKFLDTSALEEQISDASIASGNALQGAQAAYQLANNALPKSGGYIIKSVTDPYETVFGISITKLQSSGEKDTSFAVATDHYGQRISRYTKSGKSAMNMDLTPTTQSYGEGKQNFFTLRTFTSASGTNEIAEETVINVSLVKEVTMLSSTAGSTKKFKITVDDTGTLTATEVT